MNVTPAAPILPAHARHRRASSARRRVAVGLLFLAAATAPFGACRNEEKHVASRPTSRPAAKPVVESEEKGPLKVRVRIDKDRILSGESVELTIDVEVEAGVQVGVPKIEGIVGDFEVTQAREEKPECEQYKQCAAWIYTLTCVVPGEATIPPLPFSFSDAREKADGSDNLYQDELETKPIPVRVDKNLADVKEPMTLPIPFEYRLLLWAAGVLAFVIIAGLIARRLVRRVTTAEKMPSAPPVPPDEWALNELALLAAEKLIERGRIQEYFYKLNAILRQYVERRFGQMASEQTSEEFITSLQDSLFLSDQQKATLQQFTAACDPVKYAKYTPTPEEIEWVGASARAFVLETANGAQPPGAAPTAGGATTTQEANT